MHQRYAAICHHGGISFGEERAGFEFCPGGTDYHGVSDFGFGVPAGHGYGDGPSSETLVIAHGDGLYIYGTDVVGFCASVLAGAGIGGTGGYRLVHFPSGGCPSDGSGFRGKRGLAQSLFQVGGNLGGSFGPLLAALVIAPYGRQNVGLIALLALVGMCIMLPVCRWYRARLKEWDERRRQRGEGLRHEMPYSVPKTVFIIGVIIVLIFSKYIYMASLNSYYTFYLIHKFGVSVQDSQFYLFIFLFATAAGTLLGGPIGDRIGRKYVIWGSILGTAPFSLLMPHVGLVPTVILSFLIGFILSSAFPAILVYAQELLPYKIGLISGIFYGFAFGIAGIASAVLGNFADEYGIEYVYQVVAFTPLLGLVACLLPNLKEK